MYENFSDRARAIMKLARQQAERFSNPFTCPEHILLGLVIEGSGVAADVLRRLDVDLRKIRLEVEKLTKEGSSHNPKKPLTPESLEVIRRAQQNAKEFERDFVDTEDLLYGLVSGSENESIAFKVLTDLELDSYKIKNEIKRLIGEKTIKTSEIENISLKKELGKALTKVLGQLGFSENEQMFIFQQCKNEGSLAISLMALFAAPKETRQIQQNTAIEEDFGSSCLKAFSLIFGLQQESDTRLTIKQRVKISENYADSLSVANYIRQTFQVR